MRRLWWMCLLIVAGCGGSSGNLNYYGPEHDETKRRMVEAERRWPDMARYRVQGHIFRAYRKGYSEDNPKPPEVFHDPECPCLTGKPFTGGEVWKTFDGWTKVD